MLAALAGLALLIFLGGELFAFATSDLGRVLTYRHLHVGDRAHVVRIVAKRVREGLAAGRVPSRAWREVVKAGPDGGTPQWQVELPADGSAMLVNYAVTQAVQRGGALGRAGDRERERLVPLEQRARQLGLVAGADQHQRQPHRLRCSAVWMRCDDMLTSSVPGPGLARG